MIFDAGVRKYPEVVNALSFLFPVWFASKPKVIAAFEKWSGISFADVKLAIIVNNFPPLVRVDENLDTVAVFRKLPRPNISLSPWLCEGVCDNFSKPGAIEYFYVVMLHELVHFGNNSIGSKRPQPNVYGDDAYIDGREYGAEFETEAFGKFGAFRDALPPFQKIRRRF